MKKITLLILILTANFGFAQSITSNTITLDASRSVKFDINTTSNVVTMTMVMPQNTWLGIGIGVSGNIALGQGMGNSGDDAIIGLSSGILDRVMSGSTSQPGSDTVNDWTVSSNTLSGTVRTLIATRAVSTGNPGDFTFPTTSSGNFPFIYAYGGSSFGYHGSGNYGASMATFSVLSDNDFEINPVKFTISPNPGQRDLNIGITYNSSRDFNIEVFDILGKQIYIGQLLKDNTSLNVSNWKIGVYLVKISSDEFTETKRFLKQ